MVILPSPSSKADITLARKHRAQNYTIGYYIRPKENNFPLIHFRSTVVNCIYLEISYNSRTYKSLFQAPVI
jgi:hypothetical protein